MLQQAHLHLAGKDVQTLAGDNHVIQAAQMVEEAVLVVASGISGTKPTLAPTCLCGFRIVEITFHDHGTAPHDLALLAGAQQPALRIHDGQLGIDDRLADGIHVVCGLIEGHQGQQGRGFRQAVTLEQPSMGKGGLHGAHHW